MGPRENIAAVGTLRSLSVEEVAKLATLSVVSRALHTSQDPDEGLRSVLEAVMAALRADRGFIRLLGPDGEFAPEIAIDYSALPPRTQFVYSATLFEECLEGRNPVLMLDVEGSVSSSIIQTGVRSVMLYPMQNQGQLVGVLYLDSLVKAGRFGERDLELLGIIADMVGVFVERSRASTALVTKSKQLQLTLAELQNANQLLVDSAHETIYKLSRAAEFRDDEGGEHLQRVSQYCEAVALQMGFTPEIAARIKMASLLHDVGKVGIPDSILLKPGRYTEYEREVMKQHTVMGAKILAGSSSPIIRLAEQMALTHHEKWNGTGYPRALAGSQIPLAGRIVAIADVFDALTTERRYKAAWTIERALELIVQESGSHFDPTVSTAFLAIKARIAEIRERHRTALPEPVEETEAETGLALETRAQGRELIPPLRQAVETLARGALPIEMRGEALKSVRRLQALLGSLGAGLETLRRLEAHFKKPDLAPEQAARVAELLADVEVALSEDLAPLSGAGLHTILLIDPDPGLRETLAVEASNRGMIVVETGDVAAARRAIALRPPELVILEVAQPGADDFLDWFRLEHTAIPLVVLSSEGGFSRRLEVARRGGEIYLHKPLPASAVMDEIAERLGRQGDQACKVLCLDDDRVTLKAIEHILATRGFEVQALSDPLQLWAALSESVPDVLLLDLEMPTVSGFEICRVLRSDPRRAHLPIIVLTGHEDNDTYQRALEAGADDVLCKPLQPHRLVSRIYSRLGRDTALRQFSWRDPLTGLMGIRTALRSASHLFAVAVRTGAPFSICALKLERFGELLQKYGRTRARDLLRQVAQMLEQRTRTDDILAHYREDCFLLCLYGSPSESTKKLIDSFNARLAQHDFGMPDTQVCFTLFMACHPEDGTHLNELLKKVDSVLAPMEERAH